MKTRRKKEIILPKICGEVYNIKCKKKFLHSVKVLTKPKPTKTARQKNKLFEQQYCKKSIDDLIDGQTTNQSQVDPISYAQVMIEMRKCVLSNDWANLTRLLIQMHGADATIECIKYRYDLVNLVNNPTLKAGGYLDEFFKMCLACSSESQITEALEAILGQALNRTLEETEDLSPGED